MNYNNPGGIRKPKLNLDNCIGVMMIADYLSSTPRETYLMIWFSRYGCFKTWSANVCVSNVEYKCEVTYVPEPSLNHKLSVTDFIGDLQIDIRTVWRLRESQYLVEALS